MPPGRQRQPHQNADANIRFGDLCSLLRHLGFAERIRGDHHIFTRDGVAEILNLQPRSDKAKAYQVKQVRGVLIANGLAGASEAEESSEDEAASEAHLPNPDAAQPIGNSRRPVRCGRAHVDNCWCQYRHEMNSFIGRIG